MISGAGRGLGGVLRGVAWVAVGAVVLYVGLVLLIMLDLGVLETGSVEWLIPEENYDAIETFYRPLTWLWDLFFGR